MEWMILPLKRYADFSGRSRRKEFWMWVLFSVIVGFVLGLIDGIAGLRLGGSSGASVSYSSTGASFNAFSSMGVLGLIWTLATLIPSLAVSVRRLHDIDRSGWWLLLPVVPYLIGLALVLSAVSSGNYAMAGVGGVLSIIGAIGGIVLIVFYCLPGTPGNNRFGPDPLGSGNPEQLTDVFS